MDTNPNDIEQELIDRIKFQFGYPLVSVELKDTDILNVINTTSLKAVNYYSSEVIKRSMKTSENSKILDLTNEPDILRVLSIDDSQPSGSPNPTDTGMDVLGYGVFGRSIGSNLGCPNQVSILDRMMVGRGYEKLATSLDQEIAFETIENGKMILMSEPRSEVLVTYLKKWNSVSDISSQDDVEYLFRHAYLNCAILIGRARRKFKSSKSLHEIDDSMLDSAESDLKDLIEELKERSQAPTLMMELM